MKPKVYLTIGVVAVLALMGACVAQDDTPPGVTQTGHVLWSEHLDNGATIYAVNPYNAASWDICLVVVADYALDFPQTVAVSCQ
jgi:hypothetical protein